MLAPNSTVIGLDVGSVRIGVALGNTYTRMPSPHTTLIHNDAIIDTIVQLVDDQQASALVVGLPRNLSGDYTPQTHKVEAFVAQLEKHLSIPIFWQDEAATSIKATAELESRKKPYEKGAVDALAATYILEDFFRDNPHAREVVA